MKEKRKLYQGYVHTNGALIVKRYIDMGYADTRIDKLSPFVKKDLGLIKAESKEAATKEFFEKILLSIGGRKKCIIIN